MTKISAALLLNTLRVTLQHVEETANIDPHYPGLVEFKRTLLTEIQEPEAQDFGSTSHEEITA